MKKTVLIILTVIAILLLAFSAFLCFADNVKLSSMGLRMEEKISSLPYADDLRNPNATSFIKIFSEYEDLQAFIETFDADEGFSFPMMMGLVILLSISSVIRAIVFPVGAILLIVMFIKKKTVFSLKLALLWTAAGAFLTILPYTFSLVFLQKIYVMATFKFALMNLYIALAITGAYLVASLLISHFLKAADAPRPNVSYAQIAYEEGGIMYGETLKLREKKASKAKKAAKAPKGDA